MQITAIAGVIGCTSVTVARNRLRARPSKDWNQWRGAKIAFCPRRRRRSIKQHPPAVQQTRPSRHGQGGGLVPASLQRKIKCVCMPCGQCFTLAWGVRRKAESGIRRLCWRLHGVRKKKKFCDLCGCFFPLVKTGISVAPRPRIGEIKAGQLGPIDKDTAACFQFRRSSCFPTKPPVSAPTARLGADRRSRLNSYDGDVGKGQRPVRPSRCSCKGSVATSKPPTGFVYIRPMASSKVSQHGFGPVPIFGLEAAGPGACALMSSIRKACWLRREWGRPCDSETSDRIPRPDFFVTAIHAQRLIIRIWYCAMTP